MTAKESLGPVSKLSTAQSIAKQSRSNYRSFNFAGPKANNPKPEIDGLIEEGLATKTLLDTPALTVKLMGVIGEHDNDSAELVLYDQRNGDEPEGGVVIGAEVSLPPLPRTYPIDFPLQTDRLHDDNRGEFSTFYKLRFRVYGGGTGNADNSNPLELRIDRFAPYQSKIDGVRSSGPKPVYRNVPDGVIDDAWFKLNTELQLTIDTSYPFYRTNDIVKVYVSDTYSDTAPPTPTYSTTLPPSGLVNIPVSDLGSPTTGKYYVYYNLTDSVGNISKVSFANVLEVNLRPEPVLFAPTIPKAVLPDVLDLKDFETPVHVIVKRPLHALDDDYIILYADSDESPIQQLKMGSGAELRFTLNYIHLKHLITDPYAVIDTKLYFYLKRGIEPSRKSPEQPFIFDHTYRGPINPNLPETENGEMVPVDVLGESQTLNHVTADDLGKPVTIKTTVQKPGGRWESHGDERVKFWLNGKVVKEISLTGGAIPLLTYEMPPSDIEDAGPGKKIAQWSIEEDGGRNVMFSPKTEVLIDERSVTFPAPTVPTYEVDDGAGGRKRVVNCRSVAGIGINRLLPVTVIIDAAHMPKDTVVTVYSIGTEDADGLVEIEGTEFDEDYTIMDGDVGGVFQVNIQPYLTKIKPIQPTADSGLPNGYIKIWYTVPVNGKPAKSREFLNEVALLNPANNYCEGTPSL
ncbi:hypothetical protein [Pseudomonas fluorescens]|uniref:hypothetical protein n=1 Tax=Pseudomonas fluorescens TaxID=294 RepID=UPI003D065157